MPIVRKIGHRRNGNTYTRIHVLHPILNSSLRTQLSQISLYIIFFVFMSVSTCGLTIDPIKGLQYQEKPLYYTVIPLPNKVDSTEELGDFGSVYH